MARDSIGAPTGMKGNERFQRSEESCATITIGVDGRLYWHVVTREMLEIAAEICPQDATLRRRLATARKQNDDERSRHATGGKEEPATLRPR